MASRRLALLGLLAAAGGCAGARYELRADSARYPISMSPALPDADGTILYVGHGLVEVGRFSDEVHKFGFFYGATGGTLDISDLVNDAVAAYRGEGVTDLAIESGHCATNFFFPLTLLPIWPGCEVAHISGVVVRSARRTAALSPVALTPLETEP